MAKGFDTTWNCGAKASQIKSAGYDFVARYLSRNAWKTISSEESDKLRSEGLAIVLVYEDASTSITYFSNSRGQSDGARAAQQAAAVGANNNTIIYFAVDYDASDTDLNGAIADYFAGVATSLHSFGAERGTAFRAGVYGSGATCSQIVAAGLADAGWLAQSTGWRGYRDYTGWVIRQGMPAMIFGLSIDPDEAVGDYGAIQPAPFIADTSGTSEAAG